MTVLVTGPESPLVKAIVDELASAHELRLWGAENMDAEGVSHVTGDLRDPDAAWRAVRGVDAIVHTGEPFCALPDDPVLREREWLDFTTGQKN